MFHTLAIGMPGMGEWILIAAIGLLFFGKRLPEVGRSLGKGIVEFKKGLKGIEEDVDVQVDSAQREQDQRKLTQTNARFDPVTGKPLADVGHKFDPYTGEPVRDSVAESSTPSNGSATPAPPATQG